MAGGVAPDKALHQLIGADIQRVAGDVLDGEQDLVVLCSQIHIDPRTGHGVLAHIAQEIVQHPPQQAAIGQGHQIPLIGVDNHLQPPGGQFLVVVADSLVDDLVDHDRLQGNGDVARGRLAGLHQVLRQLFQPVGLPVQYGQILAGGRGEFLLLQQVHIADNAGQGGLDVVGDIGDELSFQPFGLHPLLHRLVHAHADGVQILPVALHVKKQLFRVQLRVQIPRRQGRAHGAPVHHPGVAEPVPGDSQQDQHDGQRAQEIQHRCGQGDDLGQADVGDQQ